MSNDRRVHPPKLIKKSNVVNLYKLKITKACDIEEKPQEWLWDKYIPLHTSTLFAGVGGIGKSQLLIFLASSVSTGNVFHVGGQEHQLKQGSVLILSAEDSSQTSIAPRLTASEANKDKIHIIESAVNINHETEERFIALDNDIGLLKKSIEEIGDVKLIIIDPVTAYLGDIKEHKATEVRNLILKLNKIAEEFNLSIILNTHLRKKSSGESTTSAADEVRGSGAWTGTVRQAFIIAKDHEDPKRVYFLNMKRNIGEEMAGFSYHIKPFEYEKNNSIIKTSKIEWDSDIASMSADEVIDKRTYEDRSKLEEAKDFIKKALAFGSKSAEYMRKTAENEDISHITLKRARQSLENDGIKVIIESSHTDKRKQIWYIGA